MSGRFDRKLIRRISEIGVFSSQKRRFFDPHGKVWRKFRKTCYRIYSEWPIARKIEIFGNTVLILFR